MPESILTWADLIAKAPLIVMILALAFAVRALWNKLDDERQARLSDSQQMTKDIIEQTRILDRAIAMAERRSDV